MYLKFTCIFLKVCGQEFVGRAIGGLRSYGAFLSICKVGCGLLGHLLPFEGNLTWLMGRYLEYFILSFTGGGAFP